MGRFCFSFFSFFPLSSLYFFLIGEKYFLLFLHLFCLNFFSSKYLLFHLFFSVKKLASTTQYVIVLYTTIIISIATKLNFVFFVFSSQKKLEQTDHRYS